MLKQTQTSLENNQKNGHIVPILRLLSANQLGKALGELRLSLLAQLPQQEINPRHPLSIDNLLLCQVGSTRFPYALRRYGF